MLALDDPLPGATDTWRWARTVLSRRVGLADGARPGAGGPGDGGAGEADGAADEVEL